MNAPSSRPNIYDYTSPHRYLLDAVAHRQSQDSSLSVRKLASEMGLGSHSLLVMLLQGKRPLRVKHASSIARGLVLPAQERLYLQALVQFDNAKDAAEKELCHLWLNDLHPGSSFKSQELEEFKLLSHWVHMAILSMAELRGFKGEPEDVCKRLGAKVTAGEARAAVERLLAMGLLKREASGRLRPTNQSVTTRNDLSDEGAREYHRKVAGLAQAPVGDVALEDREFQSFAIAIPLAKRQLAKDLIRKFRAQFARALADGGAGAPDDVFQMNIQFFRLTESPAPKRASARTIEDEGAGRSADTPNPHVPGASPC